jgi:alpha-2-macroglobulin-like protein
VTPESPIIAELQPLLDALCEESITPEQLRRLEELVLMHPEAEAHYIQFMSFYADLIGHVAGLPQPKANPPAKPQAASHASAEPLVPSQARTSPNRSPDKQENPMRRTGIRWALALLVVFGVLGSVAGVQYAGWKARSREVAARDAALQARQDELARVQAEQAAAQKEARKNVDAAIAAEAELVKFYQEARDNSRKAIDEKDFVVRLTGPAHIQPGAPNKWQIETLRHGAIGRPNKLDVIVKDAKDNELFRQTHDKPVGAATLELGTAFWEKVKPGSDLFLEVIAYTDDNRKSVLAERLPLARPVYITHLVTDKPLYQPGETIRFRSLTLDRSSLRPPEHDLHLIFRLRDPGDAVVPLEEGNGRVLNNLKPVLGTDKKPLRGIGVGEHTLSPEAPGGEYKLDLFEMSSETGKEVLLETRKFIVNKYVPDVFEKKLEFDGKSYGAGEYVHARIEVSRTAGGPMKDARASVVATVDGRPFHQETGATFSLVTEGGSTKAFLNVRFQLPADIFEKAKKDAPPSATLSANIQDGSDAEAIVRPIPLVTKTLNVEFFPEGGEMIEGVPGRVYFMVRTPIGKPADLKGFITDGTDTVVSDVFTLTDAENPGVNRGNGVFTLTPKAGTQYFLKLVSPLGITLPTKDGYPLPKAKADGVALRALDAVTPRGGAIRVQLQTAQGPKTLHIGAYARGILIAQQKLELEANKPVEVSLKGDEAAGGVTRVTVFEEPKGEAPGRVQLVPRAERLVFRASGEHLILNVNPDKQRYSPSDKVRLELSAFNEKEKPIPAVLMVGVVNRSVITMADNKTDRLMPTHFLLSGEVKHPAELEHADFLLTDHKLAGVALDLLLGTQGWRRFAEQDVAPANPADRPDIDKMLVAHGERTTAPLQLYKLEEQRVNAEFQPKLEQARLRIASTEVEITANGPAIAAKVAEAGTAVSAAQTQRQEAAAALAGVETRFANFREWLFPRGLLALLFAIGLFVLFMGIMRGTAKKPAAAGRPLIAGVASVAICGMVVLMLNNMGTHPNQTFSFVGSSIGGGDQARLQEKAEARDLQRDMQRMPMAPPPPGMWAQNGAGGMPMGGMGGGLPMPAFALPPEALGVKPKMEPKGLDGGGFVMPQGGKFDAHDFAVLSQTKKGGEQRADKARLAAAMKPQPGVAGGRWHSGFSIPQFDPTGAPVNPQLNAADSVIMGGQGLPAILPFVVREYAHQREPALGELRADFTETIYWHPVLVLPESGKATIDFQLSDDIARYQVLVAGHTTDGRIGAITTTIEARKPFSIDPKMPLEISHTDTIDVPIRVTNDSDVRRNVAFTTVANGFKTDGKLKDIIDLGPNGKGRKILRLNADKLEGSAGLLIEGSSIPAAEKDTIVRTIKVVPDGFSGVGSFSDMIEGKARGTIALPKDVVPGSLKVRLEVYPTSMADLVKGLDGLLQEPYGCFEQTSTSNYPNTMILDYMNQTNQMNPQAAARAKDLLARGYTRLTSFECKDTPLSSVHGFEWFGAADMQHEALSAYGLMQFKDMSRVAQVDPQLIKRTQEFLLSRRDGKGGFKQNPRALHSWGASKQVVNAYIVWALVESDLDDNEHLDLKPEIAALKADALDETSANGKDSYFLALTANIMLYRGERETAHKLLDRLAEKSFKEGRVTGAVTSVTSSGGRDLEIETTAIALLGWLRANDPKYATTVKVATKWISQQRGGHGGFGSTQSTILALKALTLHAKKSAHPAESGEVQVMVGGKLVGSRKFTEKDVEVIGLDIANPEKCFALGDKNEVEIVTDAKQPYPFALSYTYTTLTPVSAEKCSVAISTKLAKTEANEGDTVPLTVTLDNKLKQGQGMTIAIVGIPGGMKVPTDMKQLTDLREKGQISYFEIRGRELILYWREMGPEQKITLTVDLVCDVPGSYRGPASRGYLYYNADDKHWVEPLSIKIAPLAE